MVEPCIPQDLVAIVRQVTHTTMDGQMQIPLADID